MILLRRLLKSKSLRVVNVAGLAVVFACMLLSYAYVAYECSYDRFHTKADRIYRLSLRTEGEPVDVRILGFETADARTAGVSGIESVVRMYKADGCEIRHEGHIDLPGPFYFVSGNFLDVFDLRLIDGDPRTALDAPDKVLISRSYARRLFGEAPAVGRELTLAGGRLYADRRVFVGGVYEDLPETSHFHSDLFVRLPDEDAGMFAYIYLLLSPGTRPDDVARGIAANMRRLDAADDVRPETPLLFPLTDIHLRSHFQREHEPNGNILYLYLIVGANILLLVIVLFNLWLNAGLIFAFNRRYYQLLRLNGASSRRVLIDEMMIAGVVGQYGISAGSHEDIAAAELFEVAGVDTRTLMTRQIWGARLLQCPPGLVPDSDYAGRWTFTLLPAEGLVDGRAVSGTVLKRRVRFRLGKADRGIGSARVSPALPLM